MRLLNALVPQLELTHCVYAVFCINFLMSKWPVLAFLCYNLRLECTFACIILLYGRFYQTIFGVIKVEKVARKFEL